MTLLHCGCTTDPSNHDVDDAIWVPIINESSVSRRRERKKPTPAPPGWTARGEPERPTAGAKIRRDGCGDGPQKGAEPAGRRAAAKGGPAGAGSPFDRALGNSELPEQGLGCLRGNAQWSDAPGLTHLQFQHVGTFLDEVDRRLGIEATGRCAPHRHDFQGPRLVRRGGSLHFSDRSRCKRACLRAGLLRVGRLQRRAFQRGHMSHHDDPSLSKRRGGGAPTPPA